jgi:pimeloyl-ACP methyl ester carboxylesterase
MYLSRLTTVLLPSAAAVLIGCMPPSWGAAALLHPARRPLTVPTPVGAHDVVLQGDGVRLRGWQFQDHKLSVGTVIFLHGSADNRAAGVGVARHLSQRGFTVLAYDGRAHGESEGRACTYGFLEKRDLRRVMDTIGQRPIILFGTSLGAAVALQAAAEDDRISGVVAVSSFSDLRTVATERAPFFATRREIDEAFRLAEKQAGFEVNAVSPVAAASQIRVPVLLIHGANDRETPPNHSRRIYQALRGEKRLLIVPGRGHNDTLTAEVWSEIDAWIAHGARQPERPVGPERPVRPE